MSIIFKEIVCIFASEVTPIPEIAPLVFGFIHKIHSQILTVISGQGQLLGQYYKFDIIYSTQDVQHHLIYNVTEKKLH